MSFKSHVDKSLGSPHHISTSWGMGLGLVFGLWGGGAGCKLMAYGAGHGASWGWESKNIQMMWVNGTLSMWTRNMKVQTSSWERFLSEAMSHAKRRSRVTKLAWWKPVGGSHSPRFGRQFWGGISLHGLLLGTPHAPTQPLVPRPWLHGGPKAGVFDLKVGGKVAHIWGTSLATFGVWAHKSWLFHMHFCGMGEVHWASIRCFGLQFMFFLAIKGHPWPRCYLANGWGCDCFASDLVLFLLVHLAIGVFELSWSFLLPPPPCVCFYFWCWNDFFCGSCRTHGSNLSSP